MKIGIVTQPLLGNYGGVLQNFALQYVLKSMGHTCFTIAYYPLWVRIIFFLKSILLLIKGKKRTFKIYSYRKASTGSFIDENISILPRKSFFFNSAKQFDGFDAIIVGSDQVWRPKCNREIENSYLNFLSSKKIRRIAYSASFGVDWWEYSQKQTDRCSKLAHLFSMISVREFSGIQLCKDYLGVEPVQTLDPTLLLSQDVYKVFCKNVPKSNERFLAAYILNMNDSVKIECELLAKKENLIIKYFNIDANSKISVPEWLAMFRDAMYIVTDSFHGTVFSIIFGKKFKCFYNEGRGTARFKSLLKLYNSGKLDEMREFSLNWLKNALET